MRIRRYVARSVQEALDRVREELGPEALILQTRRRRRWWVPWQPPSVEVVVAWEPSRTGLPGVREVGRARPAARGRAGDGALEAASPVGPAAPTAAARPLAAAPPAATASGAAPVPGPTPQAGVGHPPPRGPSRSGRSSGALARVLREMGRDGQAAGERPDGSPGPSAAVAGAAAQGAASTETIWFQRLVEQDVEPSLAWNLVAGASARSRAARTPFDRALVEQLAAAVPTRPVWEQDRRLRTVVLVGPTGAGKTTTVAKLAANFALVAGWRVGLVAADTYRVGALQQLRTYAELIGAPLDVAQDGRELRQILAGSDRQLVLVDTAGHAPADTGRLEGIRDLCAALPEGSEVLLVVPALLRQEDLAELLEAYRQLPITGICVTKLDETRRRGALVNAPCWMGRPLRFVTTGQAVPDDIETADPQTLARWLLYGGEGGPEVPPASTGPPPAGGGGPGERPGRGPAPFGG